MKFKIGDKVRIVSSEYEQPVETIGMIGIIENSHGDWHDVVFNKSIFGCTVWGYSSSELVLAPADPQNYEVGGTLTDANGVTRDVSFIRENGLIGVWQQQGGHIEVDPTHYIYTPPVKLVPMTRELQEAIEKLGVHALDDDTTRGLWDAYLKAKELAT